MNNSRLLVTMIFGLLLTWGCQVEKTDIPEEMPEEKDRNMFGIGIPRGLTINTDKALPGYVMFSITNSASTYLINRKGEVVHEWKSNYPAGGNPYLQNDGSIIGHAYDLDFPVFAGGGEAGRIQKINWEGKMLWDFEYADEQSHTHHDIAVMPNGNILAIAWEARTYEEVLAAGRKPNLIPKAGLWPEKIVEIEPLDKTHGKIVWEWHSWDHMIQDFDAHKSNYGNPSEHPELLDINLGSDVPAAISEDSMAVLHSMRRVWRNETVDNRGSDVYHNNAINYNSELDQIAFSSYQLGEIMIIDHSTTTKEAASQNGGKSGKGGDILYRWGNPQNYQRGDSTDRQLFHQHDVRWIEKGKPGAGNLTIYNNDIPGRPDSMNYSAIYEIITPVDENGQYTIEEDKPFGPEGAAWVYTASDTVSFWSSFISGAHRMENGNTLINEGAKGRSFEVTPEGETVWEYLSEHRGEIRHTNGDPVSPIPFLHSQFRSTFIPENHPGLAGRSLEPLDPQPAAFVMPPKPKEKEEK